MKCDFCQRLEHTIHFCPSLPTRPDIIDRDEFVENLMNSPRHRALEFEGLSWEQAWDRVDTSGHELNTRNPWKDDTTAESHLRSKLEGGNHRS